MIKIKKIKDPLTEYEHQRNLFVWAQVQRCKYPELDLLNASLNGVKLNLGQAVKAKKGGMKAGYPDLFLPVPRSIYHGLFIELKNMDGKPTDEQKLWIAALLKQGYYACVRSGYDNAKRTIIDYLNGETLP